MDDEEEEKGVEGFTRQTERPFGHSLGGQMVPNLRKKQPFWTI